MTSSLYLLLIIILINCLKNKVSLEAIFIYLHYLSSSLELHPQSLQSPELQHDPPCPFIFFQMVTTK
jgi:hypothetical protein